MGFSSATVSIGANTKKSDYDRVLDNTKALKDEAIELNGIKTFQSGTVFNATATFNSEAKFNSAIVFPTFGKVGSLVLAGSTDFDIDSQHLPGAEVTGASLIYSNDHDTTYGNSMAALSGVNNVIATSQSQSASLTGTWRLLTRVIRTTSGFVPVGLLQRIS